MRFIEQTYNFNKFGAEKTKGGVFVFCGFRQVDFEESEWDNCLFIDCDFSLASFNGATFNRCLFKACDFTASFLDHSIFKECHAVHCNFEFARFGDCDFDFLSTDKCDFSRVKFDRYEGLPSECREIISEVIRQAGDHPQIIGYSSFIKNYKEFCWETLTKMGLEFLTNPIALEKVINALEKFPNFRKLMERNLEKNKGEIHGDSGADLRRVK